MFTTEAFVAVVGAVVIFLCGLGTREAVRWARGELAFSRAIRGELDAFAARWREQTGVPWGPIGDVPDHMASPSWAREKLNPQDPGEYQPPTKPWDEEVPDDDESHPHDEARKLAGAMRLAVEPRGDAQTAIWPVNRRPGAHRIEPDNRTRNLAAAVGRAAPPGAGA